jgi:type 1 glutamine amidotransferase
MPPRRPAVTLIRGCPCRWLVALLLVGCSPETSSPCDDTEGTANATEVPTIDAGTAGPINVLLFTLSTGYRHPSIPAGIAAIRALGAANGFGVDVKGTLPDARGSYCGNAAALADADYVTTDNLSRYAAVVFLNTTTPPDGLLLNDPGKRAFETYIRQGGGFVGVHAAADAEYGWSFYHELLGATFLAHGPAVVSSLHVEDASHPATLALPDPWSRFDEWYDFTANPRATAHVLISLDETTYPNNPAPMGDHPIVWCKTVEAGRSFYTGLGHDAQAFADPVVRRHLLGGILYAAGALPGDCARVGSL